MKDAKTIIPLIITGIDILIYLAPIIILFPLLLWVCLAPISQLVLAIVAIVNRKWWLLLIHIPFIAMTASVCYAFYDWIGHIT